MGILLLIYANITNNRLHIHTLTCLYQHTHMHFASLAMMANHWRSGLCQANSFVAAALVIY